MRRVRASLNPSLDIEGVLLTMNDERTNLGQQVVARRARVLQGEGLSRRSIPRNVRLAEAPSHGMPAVTLRRKSRGAEAYFVARARTMLRNAAATDQLANARRPTANAEQSN